MDTNTTTSSDLPEDLQLAQFDGHTLGRWWADARQRVHCEEGLIADVRGWGWLQYKENGEQTQDANARLIAHAPALLAHAKRQAEEITRLKAERNELRAKLSAITNKAGELASDVRGLVYETEGVDGLHLNGDVADWGSLLPGGLFERLTALDGLEDLLSAAATVPVQAAPDGWRLVPVEPTIAMCIAGDSPRMLVDDCTPTPAIYRAMIAAAPEATPTGPRQAVPRMDEEDEEGDDDDPWLSGDYLMGCSG